MAQPFPAAGCSRGVPGEVEYLLSTRADAEAASRAQPCDMRTTLRAVLDIIFRVVVFVVADLTYTWLYETVVPTPLDADIGEGLLAFALVMGVAAVWGGWDGDRRGMGRTAVIWVPAGVITGAVMAFTSGLGDPGNSLKLMLAELTGTGPFLAGLVVVPALAAAALGAAIRRAAVPTPRLR